MFMFKGRNRKYVEEAKPSPDEEELRKRAESVLKENKKQLVRANNILENEIHRIDQYLNRGHA